MSAQEPTSEELRELVASEREELAETVAELVHRADVPTRAKERARVLAGQAKVQASATAEKVRDRAGTAREQGAALAARARTQGAAATSTITHAVDGNERTVLYGVAAVLGAVVGVVLLRRRSGHVATTRRATRRARSKVARRRRRARR